VSIINGPAGGARETIRHGRNALRLIGVAQTLGQMPSKHTIADDHG
jgi:hypothetical protein